MSEWRASRDADLRSMSNPLKRWVQPKGDVLKAGWAKFEGTPDFVAGSGESKSDTNLVHYYFGTPKMEYDCNLRRYAAAKSFLQELDERGYDLSTLKFSIKKKSKKDIDNKTNGL